MTKFFKRNRSSKGLLILVVDDNPKNLQVVSSIISKAGYRVAAATDVPQAWTMIEDTLPELILLDVILPQQDGFTLCRKIKTTPETADIPIIMLTMKASSEDVVNGFEAGAADYVTKPFKAAELLARVNAHLELKRMRDEQAQLIDKLQETLGQIKQLSDMIPICAHCKKVRNDKGYWQQVEEYIATHSTAQISHSICPDCQARLNAKTPFHETES